MGTHSYRTYLISGLSAAILLPLAALLFMAGFLHRTSTESRTLETYKLTLESTSLRVQDLLEGPQVHLRLLSKDFSDRPDWDLLKQRLERLKSELPYWEYLEVLDPQGKVLFSLPDVSGMTGINRSSLEHVSLAMKNRKPAFSSSFLSMETGGAAAAFAVPFSEFTIHCQMSLGKLGLAITEASGGLLQDHNFTLTDSQGTILYHRDTDRVYRKETLLEFKDVLNLEAEVTKVLWDGSNENLILARSLPSQNWHLFLIQSSRAVFKNMDNFQLFAWLILLMPMVSLGVFTIFWSRWIKSTLASLENALTALREGPRTQSLPMVHLKEFQQIQGAMDNLTTAIRNREEISQRQMDELESKKTELEKFIYTVSHDLKSPLITIKGFLGHLRRDWEQDKADRFEEDVSRIENAAGRMQELLEDLLHLSGTAEGRERIQVFKMHAAFRSALENLTPPLSAESLKIPQAPWPDVQGDFIRLSEVWQCLLENSYKFRSHHPLEIEAGWKTMEGKTVFFLRDNGKGVPSPYQKKIFDLFEKLDPTTPGSGIGLTLAKRIVEQHHGRIWMESPGDDGGCVVYFSLPPPEAPH